MYTRRIHLWLFALLLFLACATISWAQSQSENGLRKVRFIPQWSPQAQFAGYYAAQDMGFYTERGLKVEILPGGANNPSGPALAAGEAEFASMFLSRGLILRSQAEPVVNVAQIVQRSGLMLVAKKDSGIHAPPDLEGKTVSLWPEFEAQLQAFFHKFDLDVNSIRQGYSMDLFLKAKIPSNRVHQKGMLQGMRDIIQPNESSEHIGWMNRQTYKFVTAKLAAFGALSYIEPFEVFYDPPPSAE